MSEINIDLLRKDECQPLTNEQVESIKSQFHPSNTANVNIVPYEIYDEDGEEIVVGEVRKTIDGVKKCKPLYRKIVYHSTGTTLNTYYTICSISDLETLKATIPLYEEYSADNQVVAWFQLYYWRANNNIQIAISSDSGMLNKMMYTEVRYTKTTDEWQPV